MLWTLLLFAVGICGILGFYDSIFEFGGMMRMMNSGILILLSIGMLVRTWIKMRSQTNEKLIERNAELEEKLKQFENRTEKREEEFINTP